MRLIIHIEVSGNDGFVSLSREGKVLETISNNEPMNHAGFLQPAIQQLFHNTGYDINNTAAIAVSNGPGSYTGLRVGLSAAKGLAFALQVPLLTANSLQLKALATLNHFAGMISAGNSLVCPMIDARRMEVFFGLYSKEGAPLIEPASAILDEGFLAGVLAGSTIFFTGSGANKWQKLVNHPHAKFVDEVCCDEAFAWFALQQLDSKQFARLPSAEPFYCKEFYQPIPVK